MTPQQAKYTGATNASRLGLYKELSVGKRSYLSLLYYELSQFLCCNLGGLPGFSARALLYPGLFGKCGRNVVFGRGLTLRNCASTSLGNKVLIDDYASLDVRGEDASIALDDYVTIGRFSILAAKGGSIKIGAASNIGSYCRVATNSLIEIGQSVLIAAYCYIGPGNHRQGDDEKPLIAQDMEIKGGTRIGSHSWIGARATILDGVTIGKNCIIGAHSLVKDDVPDGAVVAGTPAKIIGQKGG